MDTAPAKNHITGEVGLLVASDESVVSDDELRVKDEVYSGGLHLEHGS